MSSISKQTAIDIAYAYREIETAKELLANIQEALSKCETPDIRDALGRIVTGLELGVPTSANGKRLFNVVGRNEKLTPKRNEELTPRF